MSFDYYSGAWISGYMSHQDCLEHAEDGVTCLAILNKAGY